MPMLLFFLPVYKFSSAAFRAILVVALSHTTECGSIDQLALWFNIAGNRLGSRVEPTFNSVQSESRDLFCSYS